tara:strand:- start:111 stop:668 length:558 start_codon:yes stop_codon:yes gene_type:complete
MPHSIDFDGLESDLFILQHTAYGSREFCEKFDLNSDCYGGDYEWWEYKGILKTHVSNKIIEAAIKVRMLQDFAKHDSDDIDLKTIDADCRSGLSIGSFKGLPTLLTLRESCNKIVHATEARMQWKNSKTKPEVEYWSGGYELLGEFQGKKWQVDLSIPEWCTSMIRFNKAIQETVDWQHVEKYDV